MAGWDVAPLMGAFAGGAYNKPMKSKKSKLIIDFHSALRRLALIIGCLLLVFGWSLFFFTLLCLYSTSTISNATSPNRDWTVEFVFCGCLIVPGWLMLRLVAGLFPFGRRVFEWQ